MKILRFSGEVLLVCIAALIFLLIDSQFRRDIWRIVKEEFGTKEDDPAMPEIQPEPAPPQTAAAEVAPLPPHLSKLAEEVLSTLQTPGILLALEKEGKYYSCHVPIDENGILHPAFIRSRGYQRISMVVSMVNRAIRDQPRILEMPCFQSITKEEHDIMLFRNRRRAKEQEKQLNQQTAGSGNADEQTDTSASSSSA